LGAPKIRSGRPGDRTYWWSAE